MCSRCTMMVLLASVLTLWLGQASGADGAEAAARKPRITVANEIVAATLCTVDGKPKLLALRRRHFEPGEKAEDRNPDYRRVMVLNVEVYPILQGQVLQQREAIIWQNWHAFRPQTEQTHDAFTFVIDPTTGKPYLLWAHAVVGIGSIKVYELDPHASLKSADVQFYDAGWRYEGVLDRPESLAHICFRIVSDVQGIAGAYTAGAGNKPSLMIYPWMGHNFGDYEGPILRLELESKKLFYTDGREVKLDENNYPINKPPAAGAQGGK